MSLLLNIDTATEIGYVSIAKNGELVKEILNEEQKNHGIFLQPAIAQLLKESSVTFNDIDAIAVTAGPGSYTGIRIGMSSAKGLCYALNKPLITISTLEVIAKSVILQATNRPFSAQTLICPMIDARRMEVFTAIYNTSLKNILAPNATILSENSFNDILNEHEVVFAGSGSKKWKGICKNKNAHFIELDTNSQAMNILAQEKFSKKDLNDVAYSSPDYIKDFYTK